MNEEIEGTETEPTEPAKTELIVEQSDLDLILGFPVFEQVENVDKNTTEMLDELKKLNEHLIPTPEELEELERLELEQQEELQALQEVPEEVTEPEEPIEEEIVIDYDPLILEQLEILNAHMEEEKELLHEGNLIGAETAWLMVLTIVCAIGAKVLIEQITKW